MFRHRKAGGGASFIFLFYGHAARLQSSLDPSPRRSAAGCRLQQCENRLDVEPRGGFGRREHAHRRSPEVARIAGDDDGASCTLCGSRGHGILEIRETQRQRRSHDGFVDRRDFEHREQCGGGLTRSLRSHRLGIQVMNSRHRRARTGSPGPGPFPPRPRYPTLTQRAAFGRAAHPGRDSRQSGCASTVFALEMTAIVRHAAALERSAQAPQYGRRGRRFVRPAGRVDTRRNIDSTSRDTDVPRTRAYRLAPSTTARSTLSVSFCIRIK